jgi:O-antigen/teichoic acid export membrane protein
MKNFLYKLVLSNYLAGVALLAVATIQSSVLGLENYGQFAFLSALALLAGGVFSAGSSEILVSCVGQNNTSKLPQALLSLGSKFLTQSIASGFTVLAILTIGLKQENAILVLCTTLVAFQVPLNNFMRTLCLLSNVSKSIFWERILSSLSRLGLTVGLVAGGSLNIESVMATWAFSIVLSGIVFFLPTVQRILRYAKFAQRDEAIIDTYRSQFKKQRFLSFSGPFLSRADQVFMGALTTSSALGTYSLATSFTEGAGILASSARDSLVTTKSRAELLSKGFKLKVLLFGFYGLLALSAWILFAVSEKHVILNQNSTLLATLALLIAGLAIGSIGSITGYQLVLLNRPHERIRAQFLGLSAGLFALTFLAPLFGSVGAALASFAGSALATGANVWWFAKAKKNGIEN